jgi:formylglycine-generating enzyme required for sulfatase activity
VTVNVSAFYMGRYEVTKAEWDEVRTWGASNGYTDLVAGAGKAVNHPVHYVNWWDVIKWCNARSEMEGLTPCFTVSGTVVRTGTPVPTVDWNANGYRLPTEAEWEKAARGGVSGKRFPWGTDTINHGNANYYAGSISGDNYDTSGYTTYTYHPSYSDGTGPYTSPVGNFAANGYGLYDIVGNVWEWCWDWYEPLSYVNGATDPRGAVWGSERAIRGGAWNFNASFCRIGYRYPVGPGAGRTDSIGFRVARSSVP